MPYTHTHRLRHTHTYTLAQQSVAFCVLAEHKKRIIINYYSFSFDFYADFLGVSFAFWLRCWRLSVASCQLLNRVASSVDGSAICLLLFWATVCLLLLSPLLLLFLFLLLLLVSLDLFAIVCDL